MIITASGKIKEFDLYNVICRKINGASMADISPKPVGLDDIKKKWPIISVGDIKRRGKVDNCVFNASLVVGGNLYGHRINPNQR
jgi:hypothetical protein